MDVNFLRHLEETSGITYEHDSTTCITNVLLFEDI